MRRVFGFILVMILISVSFKVYAATKNVSNTMHNLATWSGNTIRSTNVNEVCVFCHTPHSASEVPLWNRDTEMRGNTYVGFIPYSTAYATQFLLGMETLLCMSCHDGITSMRAIHNKPNVLGSSPITMTTENFTGNPGSFADIGNPDEFANMYSVSLADAESYYSTGGAMVFRAWADPISGRGLGDHPISINYDEVVANAPSKYRTKPATLRFFGDDKDVLECTTCHDPHVDYNLDTRYRPFLAYSNRSSALCFQCHIK